MSEPEEQQTSAKDRVFGFDEDLSSIAVPAVLPVLPLRGVVVFPSAIVPLLISRGTSLKVVEEALAGDRMLALVDPEEGRRTSLRMPDGLVRRAAPRAHPQDAQVPGPERPHPRPGPAPHRSRPVRRSASPSCAAHVRDLSDVREPSADLEAVAGAHGHTSSPSSSSMIPYLPDELQVVVMNIKDPARSPT